MSEQEIRAVLFDMDGVIVDSEPQHIQAFQKTLASHGHTLDHENYQTYFAGKTDQKGLEDFLQTHTDSTPIEDLLAEKTGHFLDIAENDITPYAGIIDVIQGLRKKGIKLALVTGSVRQEVEVILSALNIRDAFDVIITADDVRTGKPDPEGYTKAVAAIGYDPEQCVIIEDSPSGVNAAVAAGIRCIAITTTHNEHDLSTATKVIAPPLTIDHIV